MLETHCTSKPVISSCFFLSHDLLLLLPLLHRLLLLCLLAKSLIYVSPSYWYPNFQKLPCWHIVPVLVSMQVLSCPCPTPWGHGWVTAYAKKKKKKGWMLETHCTSESVISSHFFLSHNLLLLLLLLLLLSSRKVGPSFLDLFLFFNYSRFPFCFVHVCLGQLLRSISHFYTWSIYLTFQPTWIA